MAHITVNDTSPRIQYTATASQVDFTVPFPFFTEASLLVYKTPNGEVANDTDDLLTLNTDYTVTGEGNVAGVTRKITLAAGATAGDIITILRDEPIERTTDFQNNGDLLAETLNDEQDKEVMIMQQLEEAVGRAIRAPVTDTATIGVMPAAADRAGKILEFDSNGDPVVTTPSALISVLPGDALIYNTKAAMAAASISDGATVFIRGYYSAGDGGHAQYLVKTAAAYGGTPDEYGDHTLANGNVAVLQHSGQVRAKQFGAKGNGATIDTAAINAAVAWAVTDKVEIYFPAGTYLSGKITLYDESTLRGAGQDRTILKLANSTNDDLIYADNSDALWGTDSTVCINAPAILDMSLDGNRANNTSGSCVAIYANRPRIDKVTIYDAPEYGMRTEWSSTASETDLGMEGQFRNIVIARSGKDGWRFAGPHDSHVSNVIIMSSSLSADRTYNNLWLEKGNARWERIHSYSTADILPLRVKNSLLIEEESSGNEFALSHFEGGATNASIEGDNNIFDDTCRFYYPWDGKNVSLSGNQNQIRGFLGEEYPGIGLPKPVGVTMEVLLGGVSGNVIDMFGSGQESGFINFVGSLGNNKVRVSGYNVAGGSVAYVNAPHADDIVDIVVHGGNPLNLRQDRGYRNLNVADVAAAGTVQGDATALALYTSIFNVNSGAAGAGVKLPSATTARNGARITIANTTASSYKVYPDSGHQVLGYGVNNPVTVPGLKTYEFTVVDGDNGEWVVQAGA